VFWNLTVSEVEVPAASVGQALSLRKAEWKLGAGGTLVLAAPAVVKFHSFVTIALFTLMSNRTW
jgi:hypothetical protein